MLLISQGQDVNAERFYFISKPLLFVAGVFFFLFLDQSASCLCRVKLFALLPMKDPQSWGCFDSGGEHRIDISAQEKLPLVITNTHKGKEQEISNSPLWQNSRVLGSVLFISFQFCSFLYLM